MTLIALSLALVGAPVMEEPVELQAAPQRGRVVGQVTVRQRVIVRVPAMPVARTSLAPTPALPPIVWVERDAPQCVPVSALSAASITRSDSVDLVLDGGKRLRAQLGDQCPALDFYTGFYLKSPRDGMICADRDVIRSRSGGECRIEGFRRLVPRR